MSGALEGAGAGGAEPGVPATWMCNPELRASPMLVPGGQGQLAWGWTLGQVEPLPW